MRAGTLGWFAVHEARLAWREWVSLMTGGRRRRTLGVLVGVALGALFLHGIAYLMLSSSATLAVGADRPTLALVTATLLMSWSLMLSQSMESVTRVFYARGDLDLILASPAPAEHLFSARIGATVVSIVLMTLVLAAPFINVMAWRGGARWLVGYPVAVALAMVAVAVALLLTMLLFRAVGPRRTRLVAQIVAAVLGAAFAIAIQFAAILSYGGLPRVSMARLAGSLAPLPDAHSLLWWPARGLLGEPAPLAALLGASFLILAVVVRVFAPRFGPLALAAGSAPQGTAKRQRASRLGARSPAQALRRKEWVLLLRDPWLMSQTLMQLLYLLPAAFLLWRSFYVGSGAPALLVPILIVAAGQLGGGLAWLAVSGEDAPDLVASAPVSPARVARAKAEAVLLAIGAIFGPLLVALAVAAPFAALVALVGVMVAAASATAIQYWFRAQARRSLFRRRQTSSRLAVFGEALSSVGWAATGAVAAAGTWAAVVPATLVLAVLAAVWLISPARHSPGP